MNVRNLLNYYTLEEILERIGLEPEDVLEILEATGLDFSDIEEPVE